MPAHPSAVIVPALLASLDGQRVPGRAFIEAYGVQPGDGMWLPPEERVEIW